MLGVTNTLNLKFPKDFFKKYAKGKPCMIRIAAMEGMQCASDETTVLCHLPGFKAMGSRKAGAPDLCAAWGCATCHGLVDNVIKPKVMDRREVELYHHQGAARTLAQLVADGVLPNPV